MAHPNHRPVAFLPAVVLLAAPGCLADQTARAPTTVVRDSAGITIVENMAPAWPDAERWSIGATPIVSVGEAEGDAAYLMTEVVGVAFLSNGGLAIANEGDNSIRYFDADGVWLRTVGGSGEGPMEFRQLMTLDRVAGEIWAGQSGSRPLKVFDESGQFLRVANPTAVVGITGMFGVFDGGSILRVGAKRPAGGATPFRTDTVYLIRFAEEQPPDTIGVSPFIRLGGGDFQRFGPVMLIEVAGDRYYYSWSETPEILSIDRTGSVERIIRWPAALLPVTDEDIAFFRDSFVERAVSGEPPSPELRQRRQAAVEEMWFADQHPAHGVMIVSDGGHLLVQRSKHPRFSVAGTFSPVDPEPTAWDVFDPDGIWLGPVEFPAGFLVLAIAEDRVAGVSKNELDVERVVVYPILR